MEVSAVAAVRRDLEALGLAETGLGASALILASRLDDSDSSATAVSNCARELRDTMGQLAALAASRPERDALDDLAAARAARLAKVAR